MKPFTSPDVARVFDAYPANVRRAMLDLRTLIFDTAETTAGVGEIEETLKWGEPAYLTAKSKSGSTVRIAWKEQQPERYAVSFHCQTNLIDTFRTLFPDEFQFEGNRAIVFELSAPLQRDTLSLCIAEALTYHLRKRTRHRKNQRSSSST
jgi:Domain of unknown function (DU1801)